MCDVLKEIYRKVYNETFNYDNLDDRIKLQKAVYLLENMGVQIGDYSFSWDKRGPYSLVLDIDAQNCSMNQEREVIFSELAERCFEKIRSYVEQQIVYNCVEWMECIASLHYLQHVYKLKKKNLITELVKRKPYLSDNNANLRALSIIKEIRVGT